jgi:hypothetical protein
LSQRLDSAKPGVVEIDLHLALRRQSVGPFDEPGPAQRFHSLERVAVTAFVKLLERDDASVTSRAGGSLSRTASNDRCDDRDEKQLARERGHDESSQDE